MTSLTIQDGKLLKKNGTLATGQGCCCGGGGGGGGNCSGPCDGSTPCPEGCKCVNGTCVPFCGNCNAGECCAANVDQSGNFNGTFSCIADSDCICWTVWCGPPNNQIIDGEVVPSPCVANGGWPEGCYQSSLGLPHFRKFANALAYAQQLQATLPAGCEPLIFSDFDIQPNPPYAACLDQFEFIDFQATLACCLSTADDA